MRTVTPPRDLTRTPRKPEPWCVLDATNTPAVMRCKHCRTEVPVHFPMDLGQHKSELDAFLNAHTLCGLGLKKLYAKRRQVQAQLDRLDLLHWTLSNAQAMRRKRQRMKELEAAINLLRTKR